MALGIWRYPLCIYF